MVGSVSRAPEFRCVRKLHRRTPSGIDFLSPVAGACRKLLTAIRASFARTGANPPNERSEHERIARVFARQRERFNLKFHISQRSSAPNSRCCYRLNARNECALCARFDYLLIRQNGAANPFTLNCSGCIINA
jgi:hypothetical protein